MVLHLGARQVADQKRDRDYGQPLRLAGQPVELVGRQAEAPHARVDVQVGGEPVALSAREEHRRDAIHAEAIGVRLDHGGAVDAGRRLAGQDAVILGQRVEIDAEDRAGPPCGRRLLQVVRD
jgi:hypothetical protein